MKGCYENCGWSCMEHPAVIGFGWLLPANPQLNLYHTLGVLFLMIFLVGCVLDLDGEDAIFCSPTLLTGSPGQGSFSSLAGFGGSRLLDHSDE